MSSHRWKPIFSVAAMAGGLMLASTVFAQYAWIDAGGIKQYSDLPPPASVPAHQILKTPITGPAKAAPAAAPADAARGDGKPKAAPTLADKNAEFIKRRTERAEREKKEAEQLRIVAEKTKNCERARQYQKTLASGIRVVSIGKNGERVFLDDAQRAQEERDTREMLKACDQR